MIKNFLGLVMCLSVLFFSSCGYERVDAGYEGIKVNLYGDGKGVDDIALVTGAVWYNPITEAVYEYPTFVQTVDYEPFSINAKDGSSFTVDPTISVKIMDGKAPDVFKKYRKEDVMEVINGTLYNYVKNAFRIELNAYTTDDLVSKREEFEKNIENRLTKELEAEGFQLEQLTSGLQYPQSLVNAINAKNKAVQDALRVANEVKVAEAEAQKLVVAAQAEKEANELRQQALTPTILQKMWIEKWNGNVPTVTGTNTNTFIGLNDLKK